VHHRTDHPVTANWKTYADNYLEGYHIPLVHPGLNRAIDAHRYEVRVDESGRFHRHDAPSRDGSPTTGAWLYLWPNTALNLYPDGMSVERFLPRGHDRVEVVFDYLFTGDDDEAKQASIASSEAIMEEDRLICEAVQRRLSSGAYTSGVLSPRHERGVAAFQQLIRDAVEPDGQELAAGQRPPSSVEVGAASSRAAVR
jgi:choline monooxygenase